LRIGGTGSVALVESPATVKRTSGQVACVPVQQSGRTQDDRTVLIADDDRDLVNLLSVRCRRMGLKVLAAHDAFTALALVRSRRPDVICLDVQMPAGNGLSVCEMLSTDKTYGGMPIVVLTGRTDPDTICRCHAMCAYYVEKCPDIWARLEPLLKELLEPADRFAATARPSEPSTPAVQTDCKAVPSTRPAQVLEESPSESLMALIADGPVDAAINTPDSLPSPLAITPQRAVELPFDDCGPRSDSEQETIALTSAVPPLEAPAESESVWRHLTQVVGRVVGRNVAVVEDDPAVASSAQTPDVELAEREIVTTTSVPTTAVTATTAEPESSRAVPATAARTAELDKALTMIGKAIAARPAQTEQKEDTPMPKKTDAQPEQTVLIADDDGDLVQMLALRCSQMGLRVFRSPDAMHALLGVHRIRPNLVVLDVNMPGGNGLSICEMLAGDEDLAKIPVIIMTGDASEDIPRRCQALRAQFLAKGTGLWERLEPLIRRSLGLPAPAAASEQLPTTTSETDADHRPRILCIDDDPDISKILKLRLEPFGIDVLRAFNGMQGYWTALDMRPDMIILDMVMPDGAGNYIFGRLRSHPLTEKVPVLMLTGVNTPGVRRQMFGMGVDAYLTKPLDFNALLDHVRQYVPLEGRDPSSAPHAEEADLRREERANDLVTGGKAKC